MYLDTYLDIYVYTYIKLCPLFVDLVTEDESRLVKRKIIFCTEAKQFKVQLVELVQFSYRLWMDPLEGLKCPEEAIHAFQSFDLF